jgi:hypothetical protein
MIRSDAGVRWPAARTTRRRFAREGVWTHSTSLGGVESQLERRVATRSR